MSKEAGLVFVDDDKDRLDILSYYFVGEGFTNIRCFSTGTEFLHHYRDNPEESPALVFLDIHIPDIDGIEVLARAKEQDTFGLTLFISYSAYMSTKDQAWLDQCGFDANLLKTSTDVATLVIKAHEFLNNREILLRNRINKMRDNSNRELSRLRIRQAVLENDYIKRLISPEVFNALDSNPDLLKPSYMDVAVGFVDIRGFTQLSNRISIDEMDELLKQYFNFVSKHITSHKGFIDKYIGDAVMWFHKGGDLSSICGDCISTASDVICDMKRLNETIRSKLHKSISISIGVGIASGKCAIGLFGAPDYRIQYSALGPPVNLAARLCSEARSGKIVIGGSVIEYCPFRTRKMGYKPIKGFDHNIELRSVAFPLHPKKKVE